MKVFVTGASGFIGSHVVQELRAHGHEVIGLARSDASASALEAAGVAVLRGDLETHDVLRQGAQAADGVIHLAYVHDFSGATDANALDRAAVETFGEALAGTDRPLVIASGTLTVAPGGVATEESPFDTGEFAGPRAVTARVTLALAERGVRPVVVRLSPSVHDERKGGFAGIIAAMAEANGVAGYLGDGSTRWPAVHVKDAASLFRLGLEQAPAGSILHGVGEEGITMRAIAETIGQRLNIPVQAIADADAAKQFGFLAPLVRIDAPATSALTRARLGWEPTHPGLLEDLAAGSMVG